MAFVCTIKWEFTINSKLGPIFGAGDVFTYQCLFGYLSAWRPVYWSSSSRRLDKELSHQEIFFKQASHWEYSSCDT